MTANVATFVFFDLEATGLKGLVLRPKITELAMIAVSKTQLQEVSQKLHDRRRQLLEKNSVSSGPVSPVDNILPRVMNKLVLPFFPRTRIDYHVSDLTGLDNYNLEDQCRFDADTVQLIQTFLKRLKEPLCFVAHNGTKYDFPLIKAEMLHGTGENVLSNYSYVDSLEAVKLVYEDKQRGDQEQAFQDERHCLNRLMDEGHFDDDFYSDVTISSELPTTPPARCPDPNGANSSTSSAATGISLPKPVFLKHLDSSDSHTLPNSAPTTPDRDPAMTPISGLVKPPNAPKRPKRRGSQTECRGVSKVRRKLDFDSPQSFSLPKLHEHIFGQEPVSTHGAEQGRNGDQ